MVLQRQLRTTDSSEISYILESCAIENHQRQVFHARVGGFEAWRRLLDLALMKCFDRLPHNHCENMLFDLLHVLPVAIRSAYVEESTAILLSETALSSITKLREDRQHQIILQSVGSESEPRRTCTWKPLCCAYQLRPPHAIIAR